MASSGSPTLERSLSPSSPLDKNVPSPPWTIPRDALERKEKVGAGQFGIVHRALWNGASVAMKTLKPGGGGGRQAKADFLAETEVMQRLRHPNIVQFHGRCEEAANDDADAPLFLVTELSTGGSLQDYFQRRSKRLPLSREIELAIDCAKALNYLHATANIVHRDLKPANLLIFFGNNSGSCSPNLRNEGTLKLTDFGLSKRLPGKQSAESPAQYKMTGETGSFRYMAPEVYRHEDYNHKVDVYAFGMILFQLLEGRQPFAFLTPEQGAAAASLKDIRPAFKALRRPRFNAMRRLIERCWAPKPEDRPEFEILVPQLEACLEEVKAWEGTKWWETLFKKGGGKVSPSKN